MTDSRQMLLDTILGRWRSQILYAGVSLGILEALSNQSGTSEQVASQCSLNPEMTYRLMRALASIEILDESDDRMFSLTKTGRLLTADHPESMRSMILLEVGPEHCSAWRHLPDIIREGGKDGFHREYGKPLYLHASENAGYGEIYHDAMSNYASSETAMFLDAIGTDSLSDIEHICDVGGNDGHLMCHVLDCHPHLEGTVFDMSSNFEDRDRLWSENTDVQDRCHFLPGNMFEFIPEADGYIMKHILHAWNDEESIAILKKIAEASPDKARLFIAEFVIPDSETPHYSKLFDVHMMCTTSGRERTEKEYNALLQEAGWRHKNTSKSFGPLNVIEAVKV